MTILHPPLSPAARLFDLPDGSYGRIRPSGPSDRKRLAECYAALSSESRRLRFFGLKSALSPSELDLYTGADGQNHIALAAVRITASGQEGDALGFARCLRLGEEPETAEMSITVVDAAQGQGIGAALLTDLITRARDQGVRRFRCEVLAENGSMRRLAERLGAKARWLGDGTLEYDCPLPAPSETDPDLGPPWFANPEVWVGACVSAWLTALHDTLTRVRAANGGWDPWFGTACPLGCRDREHQAA